MCALGKRKAGSSGLANREYISSTVVLISSKRRSVATRGMRSSRPIRMNSAVETRGAVNIDPVTSILRVNAVSLESLHGSGDKTTPRREKVLTAERNPLKNSGGSSRSCWSHFSTSRVMFSRRDTGFQRGPASSPSFDLSSRNIVKREIRWAKGESSWEPRTCT